MWKTHYFSDDFFLLLFFGPKDQKKLKVSFATLFIFGCFRMGFAMQIKLEIEKWLIVQFFTKKVRILAIINEIRCMTFSIFQDSVSLFCRCFVAVLFWHLAFSTIFGRAPGRMIFFFFSKAPIFRVLFFLWVSFPQEPK